MAIRDIIVRGFGNGIYDPGVAKLPTRGYSIGVAQDVTPVGNPFYRPLAISVADTRRLSPAAAADSRRLSPAYSDTRRISPAQETT